MPAWRNWQTRWTQNPAFDPRDIFALPHSCEHGRQEKNRNDRGMVNIVSTAQCSNLVLRALVVLLRVLLHPLLVLTTRDDKVVIFTVTPPRAGRHIADLNKLPVDDVGWREAEIIANGW